LKKRGTEHVDVGKEFLDRALAIRLKRPGPENLDVAFSNNDLGTVYGDLQLAKECHDDNSSLIFRLNKFKTEHLDAATNFINLGYVAFTIGDLEQGKECNERALNIRLKREGPSQVDVATIYNKLGNFHHGMCGLQQAKDCYDKALSI
ncbi:unnamed protein product, partial [Pocillopora meandrina]